MAVVVGPAVVLGLDLVDPAAHFDLADLVDLVAGFDSSVAVV